MDLLTSGLGPKRSFIRYNEQSVRVYVFCLFVFDCYENELRQASLAAENMAERLSWRCNVYVCIEVFATFRLINCFYAQIFTTYNQRAQELVIIFGMHANDNSE